MAVIFSCVFVIALLLKAKMFYFINQMNFPWNMTSCHFLLQFSLPNVEQAVYGSVTRQEHCPVDDYFSRFITFLNHCCTSLIEEFSNLAPTLSAAHRRVIGIRLFWN